MIQSSCLMIKRLIAILVRTNQKNTGVLQAVLHERTAHLSGFESQVAKLMITLVNKIVSIYMY